MQVILRKAYEIRLDEAVAYLLDLGANAAAQRLLDQAYGFLPDLLARFPRTGRGFLARNPEAPEVLAAWKQARELSSEDIELREYVLGEYLVHMPFTASGSSCRRCAIIANAVSILKGPEPWR